MKLLQNVREVFKSLKHRELSRRMYCPRCGSPRIYLSRGFYLLAPRKYVCEDCGYVGPIVMELEKEENSQDNAV